MKTSAVTSVGSSVRITSVLTFIATNGLCHLCLKPFVDFSSFFTSPFLRRVLFSFIALMNTNYFETPSSLVALGALPLPFLLIYTNLRTVSYRSSEFGFLLMSYITNKLTGLFIQIFRKVSQVQIFCTTVSNDIPIQSCDPFFY